MKSKCYAESKKMQLLLVKRKVRDMIQDLKTKHWMRAGHLTKRQDGHV